MKRELKKPELEKAGEEFEEVDNKRRKYKGGFLISLLIGIPFSFVLLPMLLMYVINKGILLHIFLRNEIFKDWETIKKKA